MRTDRPRYLVATVLLLVLAGWAVVNVRRGDRGGLVVGANLAAGVSYGVAALRRLPRR